MQQRQLPKGYLRRIEEIPRFLLSILLPLLHGCYEVGYRIARLASDVRSTLRHGNPAWPAPEVDALHGINL